MESPRIKLFDKDFVPIGEIGEPLSFTATPRHMLSGTGSISLPASHRLASKLVDPDNVIGPRVLVEYRGEELLSGWVGPITGAGPGVAATLNFQIDGYFSLLHDVLAWPNPSGSITNQGGDKGFYRASGPAETVAKDIIRANCARLGIPVEVEPSAGRGARITVEARFSSLADVLLEKVEAAGIGLRVVQGDGRYIVKAYESAQWGQTLTEASGSVTEWSWTKQPPRASRVVVGGSGARELRVFRNVVDTVLENGTKRIRERFTDGLETIDAGELDNAGRGYLANNGPAFGLAVTLQESKGLHYGGPRGIHVGDKVSLEVGPGLVLSDILREVTLRWDETQGLVFDQKVGTENPDPAVKMVKMISSLGSQLRILKAGK